MLVACILGSVIVFVDSTVVNVALPAIQRDLGGGLALQQWVVDAYLLTLGSLLLVGGSLGDLFGARRLFLIGIVAFGITSVACAAAPDGNTLIVARGFQGVAGAILTPAGLAVIAATFSGEARGAAIGQWTSWTGVAFVIGPLVGGWLVTHASWRWVFIVNVPFAIATAALVAYAVPKRPPRETKPRVDIVGAVLCVLGLGGPVFALIEEPRRGWSSPAIFVPLVAGIAFFAAFLWWEQRTERPMLPLGLFARRNFTFANIETLTVYAGLSTLTFFLVLFVQQLAGYSALKSGLALLPITVVMFFLSPRVGRLSMRLGPRIFMGGGPAHRGRSTRSARAPEAGIRLLDRAAAAAARLLGRVVADRRAADGNRARRRATRATPESRAASTTRSPASPGCSGSLSSAHRLQAATTHSTCQGFASPCGSQSG